MGEPTSARQVVRFGVFEVDLRAGELRKKGVRIRLQEQPLQVLAVLLGQPGDVVTREDLKQKLWGGTIVDFDHSINTTINKLREALGDSADAPRFIETLPRRGYRFIYPVDVRTAANGAPGAAPLAAVVPEEASPVRRPAAPWLRLRWARQILAVLATVLLGILALNLARGARAVEVTSIAVLPLQNFS